MPMLGGKMSEVVDMKFVEDVVLALQSDGKGGNELETVAEDEELLDELGTKDGTGTGVVGNNAAGSNLALFPGPGTLNSGKMVLKLKLT